MTYEYLKKNAIFLGEVDFNHNGIFAGTDYYFLFKDRLYCRHQPTNAFTYDGEIKTDEVPFDDLQQDLKKHSFARFDFLSVEIYQKLCRIYNTETRFGWMYDEWAEKEGISDAELDEFMQGVNLPTPKSNVAECKDEMEEDYEQT